MTHVTSRLTAKNWDQLRNPALGNRVWAIYLYLFCIDAIGRIQWMDTSGGGDPACRYSYCSNLFLVTIVTKQPTFCLLIVIREYVSVESLPVGPNRRTGERSVSVTLCICWEEHPLYADWNWCLTSLHDVQITCVYRRWQNDAHGLWYLTVDMGETRVNTEYGERRIIGDRGRSPDISP